MAGIAGEDSGAGRASDGISSGQRCQSGELAEWRSSEQVENGTPSTSPPYWDTDDDDHGGPKPSQLYGKHTWKIEKFSQINKRELRSNAFEVGGYKWYILIYPQGCDVCNHLSLFLCVANHDKLLPGWSHFAQFTIAVVNKDPKKSKYSDTLHRFWKKEHDWGWKKFMELSKVLDGFTDSDTLIIKAQVQVIREKADRPFRCLDCQYRRELVRVYLSNVEQICRRFVEERRSKHGKLIEDKARWSSFRTFWLGIDQNSRRRMSREKTDSILKVVVKHFFIEKEVTSTLVMDSLYSGLKALEGQTKSKKAKVKLLEAEEMTAPIVRVEKDAFVLVDDVLLLLERAALEPLPPKDEKGPQNRTKDGSSGEDFNKDSIERDESRLTDLGRRTLEIFVLAHIFSNKIEVAYQEAVALKRQEELIREEEAAWLAESEQKAKRTEKKEKSKKKQGKQKRNNRKGKDKVRDERPDVAVPDKHQQDNPSEERKDTPIEAQPMLQKPEPLEDVSDLSDSVDGLADVQPDSEDRDACPINWDTDTSEVQPSIEPSSSLPSVQNGISDKKNQSLMDDTSSTCSTDSVPSVVMSGPYKGNSSPNIKNQKSRSRVKNQGKAASNGGSWENEVDNQSSVAATDAGDANDASGSSKTGDSEPETSVNSLQDRIKWLERHVVKKEAEAVTLQKKLNVKDQAEIERPSKDKTSAPAQKTQTTTTKSTPTPVPASFNSPPKSLPMSSPSSPPKSLPTTSPSSPPKALPTSVQLKSEGPTSTTGDPAQVKKIPFNGHQQIGRVAPPVVTSSSPITIVSRPETQKPATPKATEKAAPQQAPTMSRPSSAPLVPPGPRPSTPVVSMVQTSPLLARSVSAAGRLGPDPSPATHSYIPQSYRNAMMGKHVPSSAAHFYTANPSSSGGNQSSPVYSQPTTLVSAPMFLPQSSERVELGTMKSGFPFGMVTRGGLHNGKQWMESSKREANTSPNYDPSLLLNNIQNLDLYKPLAGGSREHLSSEFPAGTSGRQTQGLSADEFPHLDIINDLLNDENGIGNVASMSSVYDLMSNGPNMLNRQLTFPGDLSMAGNGGSSMSSCRFERTRSYHDDGFNRAYGSSGGHYEPVREFIPQASPSPYTNGQIDGMVPNQWQMPGPDMPLVIMRTAECEAYPYYNPECSNLACGVNGYTMFRPSNGH